MDDERAIDRLLELLDELVQILDTTGEHDWADWLRQDRRWIEAGDFYGVEHFLTAFGGMGSINDRTEWVLLGEAHTIARGLQRSRQRRGAD